MSAAADEPVPARLSSEALFELTFASDPQVSPTGERLAGVITRIVREGDEAPRYRSHIALLDADGGPPTEFEARHSDTRPRFSTDGSRLAYLTKDGRQDPAQIALRELDGGEPELLTDEKGGVLAFEWRPGRNTLAYLASDGEQEAGQPVAREIDRLSHKADGKGYLPRGPRRLRLLHLGGEARNVLLPAGMDPEGLAWSGDGRWLFVSSAADQDERDEATRRLWRIDPEGGEVRRLTEAGRMGAFAPDGDGSRVAFLAPANDDGGAGPSGVWLLQVESQETRLLSGPDRDLSPALGGDAHYGEFPNRPHWVDGERLLVNHNLEGRSRLALLSIDGAFEELDTGERHVVSSFAAGQRLTVFTREDSSAPPEFFLLDGGGNARQLTDLNGHLRERYGFRRAAGPFVPDEKSRAAYWRLEPLERRSDGALVLQVHGGPHTNVGEAFYFEFQLLAARGYTVIYGNPRGSSSYGREFATSILGDYGSIDADDVLSFADHASANHAEPEAPMHLTGGSYGGFMTNWLVAHSDRFRSAVTQRSICNFVSFYGTSDIGYWFGERELHGNPWDDHELLWRQSPLRLAHRISTPLLILHSEADLRCPVEQAQQLYTAVKRSGRAETKMVLFPEESHELSRSGRPDRRIRRLDEIVAWFESHP